jgi:hypothetical protein
VAPSALFNKPTEHPMSQPFDASKSLARGGSDGFLMESLMASIAIGDDEAQARINAFLEKRGPKITHFSGRGAK